LFPDFWGEVARQSGAPALGVESDGRGNPAPEHQGGCFCFAARHFISHFLFESSLFDRKTAAIKISILGCFHVKGISHEFPPENPYDGANASIHAALQAKSISLKLRYSE